MEPTGNRLHTFFLPSDEAAYITGGEFIIDGGACLPEINAMGLSK